MIFYLWKNSGMGNLFNFIQTVHTCNSCIDIKRFRILWNIISLDLCILSLPRKNKTFLLIEEKNDLPKLKTPHLEP